MKDQPSPSENSTEPQPRPRSIPDDFIWDQETESWFPPGEPMPPLDHEAWLEKFERELAIEKARWGAAWKPGVVDTCFVEKKAKSRRLEPPRPLFDALDDDETDASREA